MPPPYGAITVELREYIRETLTPDILQLALDFGLFDPDLDENVYGLYSGYVRALSEQDEPFEYFWLVFVDGVPVGAAAVQRIWDRELHLYVNERYRRRGLGDRLMRAVMARNLGKLCGYPTPAARTLYQRYGLITERAANQESYHGNVS